MKRVLSLIIILQMLALPVHAQENGRAVYLEKGSSAPYTGTLLDDAATAKIIADRERQAAESRALAKKLVDESAAKWSLERANLIASQRSDISILSTHAAVLEEDLKKQKQISESKFSWTTLGLTGLVGISLGVLTALFVQKR